MPRIKAYRNTYIVTDLYMYIKGEMRRQGITQKELSEVVGCKQPDISKKFEKYSFTTLEMVKIFEMLGTEAETIGRLWKGLK